MSININTFAEVCYKLRISDNGEHAIELLAAVLNTAPDITSVCSSFRRCEDKVNVYRVLRNTLNIDLQSVQEYVDSHTCLEEQDHSLIDTSEEDMPPLVPVSDDDFEETFFDREIETLRSMGFTHTDQHCFELLKKHNWDPTCGNYLLATVQELLDRGEK